MDNQVVMEIKALFPNPVTCLDAYVGRSLLRDHGQRTHFCVYCHGAGKGHRGETGVWFQMLVKRFTKQQKGQQAKNRTEIRVGHHRRQHSAGVLESREQND